MRWLAVVGLGIATVASAKPLPDGTKVVLARHQLWFVDHGIQVPLLEPDSTEFCDMFTVLHSAVLSADGATIEVDADNMVVGAGGSTQASLAASRARVEDARGRTLRAAKRPVDAIARFQGALALDPQSRYATDLLAAQVVAKRFGDADATLASFGARAVPYFAWRFAVDRELAPLRTRDSAKPFIAATRSTLAYHSLETDLAVSPDGSAYAQAATIHAVMGPDAQDLVVFAAGDGHVLLRLPIVTWDDACTDDKELIRISPTVGCTPKKRAHVAANQRVAVELLESLGYAVVPVAWHDIKDPRPPVSPDKAGLARSRG